MVPGRVYLNVDVDVEFGNLPSLVFMLYGSVWETVEDVIRLAVSGLLYEEWWFAR